MLKWSRSHAFINLGFGRHLVRLYTAYTREYRPIYIFKVSPHEWRVTLYQRIEPDIVLGTYKTLKEAKAAAELIC